MLLTVASNQILSKRRLRFGAPACLSPSLTTLTPSPLPGCRLGPDPEGLTPPKILEMLFGLLRKRTVSLSARSWRLSGRCIVAALLWVAREVGTGVLGAAFWAPLPVCLKPTSGLSCCRKRVRGMSGSKAGSGEYWPCLGGDGWAEGLLGALGTEGMG